MAVMKEIENYRSQFMRAVCTSDEIANLLALGGDEPVLTGQDLKYTRVFPYPYIPDVTKHAECYICFEVDVASVQSDTIKTLLLRVYVLIDRSMMRLNGGGIRPDRIIAEIDRLLNGSTEFGLGHVELVGLESFVPVDGFYGRQIRYRVQDYNRSVCETEWL